MSFMNKELSDDLLPFSGKLSERFYEVRENVAGFCAEIEKIGAQLGSLPARRPPLAHTAAQPTLPPWKARKMRLCPQFRGSGGEWWVAIIAGPGAGRGGFRRQ